MPPIALAEVQGYVFDAKRRMAAPGRDARRRSSWRPGSTPRPTTLRHRFEEAFWVEDRRFYAMALDGDKRQADAIGRTPASACGRASSSPERARDVVERLLRPAMFSGWGIRTYAADQPGYNPIGYHTGTVWPHDTSLIAAGFKRYGFDDASNRLVGHMIEAAQRFPDYRLPELFCGFDRERRAHARCPTRSPARRRRGPPGRRSCSSRRCSGLRAHAERSELELLHPHLPDWLGKVTLTDLRVGEASVDLLFHRWRGTTSAEVLRKVGDVAVTIRL